MRVNLHREMKLTVSALVMEAKSKNTRMFEISAHVKYPYAKFPKLKKKNGSNYNIYGNKYAYCTVTIHSLC